jgi:hypothetical protein
MIFMQKKQNKPKLAVAVMVGTLGQSTVGDTSIEVLKEQQ